MSDVHDEASARKVAGVVGVRGCGAEPETSDSLKTFGAFVQGLREHAKLTRKEFAKLVQFSLSTVVSIENGRRLAQPEFVERAEELTGNTGALRKAAPHVARKPGLARWFREWAQLETEATSLNTYECRVIPGLLQTEAYARAVFGVRFPPLRDDEIDTQWQARVERQQLLHARPNSAFSFILEEHLFLCRIGGTEAMRDLIGHVLRIAELRNVDIQIMPLAHEAHVGVNGPIRLLETPENRWYGYNEGQESGELISERKVVSVLQGRYARMSAQALTPQDSVSLLHRIQGAL